MSVADLQRTIDFIHKSETWERAFHVCENETGKNKGHVYFYMSARRQLHATFPKVLKLLGKGAQNKVFLQAGMSDSLNWFVDRPTPRATIVGFFFCPIGGNLNLI